MHQPGSESSDQCDKSSFSPVWRRTGKDLTSGNPSRGGTLRQWSVVSSPLLKSFKPFKSLKAFDCLSCFSLSSRPARSSFVPCAPGSMPHAFNATDSILCNLVLGTLLLIALSFAKCVKLAIRLLNVKIGAKIRGCKNKA